MEDAIKLLLTYGPGGVIAALVVLGVLVPSKFYEREIKRGDTATQTASSNAEALKEVTAALKTTSDALTDVREELKVLRSETLAGVREELKTLRSEISSRRH
jgi:septation ring formation regulator EzrA